MNSIIEDVNIRKILDSRGNPTLEVDILTPTGYGRAAAPSGASTGEREVVSFPEGGVTQAINQHAGKIISELVGLDASEGKYIDQMLKEMDGTDDLSSLGGNFIVAISMAAAKAAASSYALPFYRFLGGNMVEEIPYPLET